VSHRIWIHKTGNKKEKKNEKKERNKEERTTSSPLLTLRLLSSAFSRSEESTDKYLISPSLRFLVSYYHNLNFIKERKVEMDSISSCTIF
jgi:hypothetical protein